MGKEKYLDQLKGLVNHAPYYELLGMEVLGLKNGEATLRMPFRKELTHPYGMVHGGAIASLADSAVAVALASLVDPNVLITTIEFKINFMAPVSEGSLIARAKILHKGVRTAVGDVEVVSEDGTLVAKMVATYSILKVT